jgi:uncharacterized protein YlxP (DUF503 family)
MPIGKLTIELSIPHAQSLKDRRQVVRSLKDKLRHAFNLSIAELNEGGPLWNRATFHIAVVSSSMPSLLQHLQTIDRAAIRLAAGLSAQVTDSYAEVLGEEAEPLALSSEPDERDAPFIEVWPPFARACHSSPEAEDLLAATAFTQSPVAAPES